MFVISSVSVWKTSCWWSWIVTQLFRVLSYLLKYLWAYKKQVPSLLLVTPKVTTRVFCSFTNGILAPHGNFWVTSSNSSLLLGKLRLREVVQSKIIWAEIRTKVSQLIIQHSFHIPGCMIMKVKLLSHVLLFVTHGLYSARLC